MAKNQQDLVKNFMRKNNIGEKEAEAVRFPNLDFLFEIMDGNKETYEESAQPYFPGEIKFLKIEEIAQSLYEVILSKENYVKGFSWEVGDKVVKLKMLKDPLVISREGTSDEIYRRIVFALKCRKEVSKIEWDFGDKHMSITH